MGMFKNITKENRQSQLIFLGGAFRSRVREQSPAVTPVSQFSHTGSCFTASSAAGGETGHETPDRRTISVLRRDD